MAKRTIKDKVDRLTLGNAYLNQDNSDNAGDTTERRRKSGYSSYYHKYFEGYVERHVTDDKGKVRIERIYAGDTYRHKLTDKQWVGLKLLYIFMFAAVVAVYLFTISMHVGGYTMWYMKAAEAAGVLALFVLLYTLVNYTIAKRDLTIWGYKESSSDFKLVTLISAVCTLLPAVTQLIHIVIAFDAAELAGQLALMLGCIVSALVLLVMRHIEDKVIKYDKIPCSRDIPSDAVSIW